MEGRLSVERRPCALSAQHQVGALLWFKPVHCRCPDELLEASGWWRLGPSRSGVGLMWLRGTWIGAMECRLIRLKADAYQTANLTARWKLLEQGPEKSVCFSGLRWWSVCRHRFLRSRCTHSRHFLDARQSAVVLIAFSGLVDRLWK